jgi:hypothetical protein
MSNDAQTPKYKRIDGEWWYEQSPEMSHAAKWVRWNNSAEHQPVQPPNLTWVDRMRLALESNSALPPLIIGVTAVLVALGLALLVFGNDGNDIVKVLAPILTAIGAFTGHAAGHAAAKQK